MKEPNKIPLNPNAPKSKVVNKIPMPSLIKPEWDIMPDSDSVYVKHLHDDFGYVLSIKNEDNSKNHS